MLDNFFFPKNLFSVFFLIPLGIFFLLLSPLRYGVFEEHGFPGDPAYPMFYYETEEAADDDDDDDGGVTYVLKPSFCTNQELRGHKE